MAQPFPLPPETRQTPTLFGDGVSATYGPFSFKAFETGDIKVYRKLATDIRFAEAAVVVTKTTGQPQDTFTVTFPAVQLATTRFVVVAKRLHTRTAGLDKGLGLSVNALEKELSKQGTILQELRRDIEERAIKADYDIDVPTLIEQGVEGHLLIFGPNNTIINTDKTLEEILADILAAVDAAVQEAQAAAADAANSAVQAAGSAAAAANSANDAAASAAILQSAMFAATGAPLETIYDYDGGNWVVHNLQPKTGFIQFLGVGGGAAGESVSGNGVLGNACGSGGASGMYGETAIYPVTGFTALGLQVGAGGVPGSGGGGFSAVEWIDGKYFVFWGGLQYSAFVVGCDDPPGFVGNGPSQEALVTVDTGNYKGIPRSTQQLGERGNANLNSQRGGNGGSSPWGRGGVDYALAQAADGMPGQGFGSGGSGAFIKDTPAATKLGGNGAPGRIIVREWYVP